MPAAARAWGVLLLLVVATAGCGGGSPSSIADRRRAQAEPKIAALRALAADVDRRPPVTADGWTLPAGEKLDFIWHKNPAHNASIAYAVHLADPCTENDLKYDNLDTSDNRFYGPLDDSENWLRGPACLLQNGTWLHGVKDVEAAQVNAAFDRLAATKYALIVRIRTAARPTLVESEIKAGELETFHPGRVAGDALLYEVASGRLLGGFAFDVTSTEKVEVYDRDMHSQLESSLLTDLGSAMRDKIGKLPPGGVPPH